MLIVETRTVLFAETSPIGRLVVGRVIEIKYSISMISSQIDLRILVYAVSDVYRQYSTFRRGSVWAKVIQPNIPVSNGVVHVIDNVLGVVTNTIDQILNMDERFQ